MQLSVSISIYTSYTSSFPLYVSPKNKCAHLCVYTYTNDTPPDLKAVKFF